MPLNDYICSKCNKVFTIKSSDSTANCPVCNAKSDWTPSFSYRKSPFKAFVTKHINGQPIEIDSITKLRKVEKQYGVNFPAYGDSMLGDSGQKETHWTDEHGVTHRE